MIKRLEPLYNMDGQPAAGYFPPSWGDVLSKAAESVDEQPEGDSEDEVLDDGKEETDDLTDEETDEPSEDEEPRDSEDEDTTPEAEEDPEVDLGDGKKPVKLSEVKAGYLRQSDYTKKTQALADERKAFDSEKAQYEPMKQWTDYAAANPWLIQQIDKAVEEWQQSGVLPLAEMLADAEHGKYINELMKKNAELTKQLESVNGEFETVKLSSAISNMQSELKEEYGELVTKEYMQQLQERGKTEKLSIDTLKEIADGYLAKQALKSNKEDVKKVSKQSEAAAIQKLQETRKTAPKAPKSTGKAPAKPDKPRVHGWEGFFHSLAED